MSAGHTEKVLTARPYKSVVGTHTPPSNREIVEQTQLTPSRVDDRSVTRPRPQSTVDRFGINPSSNPRDKLIYSASAYGDRKLPEVDVAKVLAEHNLSDFIVSSKKRLT